MRTIVLGLALAVMALTGWEEAAAQTAPDGEHFRQFVRAFRAEAVASGLSAELYDRVTAGLKPDFTLPDLDPGDGKAQGSGPDQPEFVRTPEQYLSAKALSTLTAQGKKLVETHRRTLAEIEKTYAVDPAILLALWGRETAFGTYKLPYNALEVLAVQAYAGRRKELFQKQFLLAIKMVQDGVIAPRDMHSSWAGALGLVQFLPSDYYKFAVDADGDGRRDIWNSVPDALASLANNLKSLGWDKSQPWGFEVQSAASIDCSLANLDVRKPVREWQQLGVIPIGGGAFPASELDWEASLLLPAGTYGPAFLTFNNFQVLREYNKADLYALFVGHLADRIRGRGDFSRRWQPAVQVATRDVEDMQQRLTALGFYNGIIDGKAGGRTRSAVGAYERQAGVPQTCWPTAALAAKLQEASRHR